MSPTMGKMLWGYKDKNGPLVGDIIVHWGECLSEFVFAETNLLSF